MLPSGERGFGKAMSALPTKRAYRPENLAEALAIRAEFSVTPVAGGTDLMVKRRHWSGIPRFQQPALFISHLHELKGVSVVNAGSDQGQDLRIGAACTFATLLEDARVPNSLAAAIRGIGGPAIKNAATLGGNICNASPAGDTLPILYALGSSVELASNRASRNVPIEEFITGPGTTILARDELLVNVTVPMLSFDTSVYRKVGTRRANALSKLSFVGLARRGGSTILDFRVAFGSVAPTVIRCRDIEITIAGQPIEALPSLATATKRAYAELIRPIDDQRSTARYREVTALRLLDHFLTQLQE